MTQLVEERLIACAQLTNIESTYRWQGKVEAAAESRAFLHTTPSLADRVVQEINDRHPYEVACVLVIAVVGGNPDYLSWVEESTLD